ncbi:hypothetical protein BOTCAL_0187g00110 [Botryotinia calthae]|uniref:Uncharacterized protein n=1 Tax=Botryotinia calthae TaxID=38488 RepID=A0A4Y8D0T7_9HELO|nr:hypothetical protein BOTCAL_0187g00110 [Botryotinia calthae]
MNSPNNATSGHYCEIDRFRCLKCEHDDYRHRYRCERHLLGDAYCRETIPMITRDRNVFCKDCAEDEDLEAGDQGHVSPELSAIHFVDVDTNIIQEVIEIQPVSTDTSQSEDTVGPDMPSGGWGEPGGISLQRLNSQSSAHVPPGQDLAIQPLAPQNFLTVPPSSTHINTNTAPPSAPPTTPAPPPILPPTPTPPPTPEPASGSASERMIRQVGTWERFYKRWCCWSLEESLT